MKLLICVALIVLAVNAERVKRGDLGGYDFGGEELGGHHELHGHHEVATSYQNVHLESHNPVPVVIHKHVEAEHHGLGSYSHSLEEHGGAFDGHGLEGLELHGLHGHEGY